MTLRTFRSKLVKNIRPGTTSACHLEGKKRKCRRSFNRRKALFLNRIKEFTILLLSNDLPPTAVPVHEELTPKISQFTIRSIVYQWNDSRLFNTTGITPQIHQPPPAPTDSALITQAQAGTHLTPMPVSNRGEGTSHLLPRVIHLGNDSRLEHDSRCRSTAPQRVTLEICPNKKEAMHEQETEKRKPFFLKKGGAKCVSCGFSKPTV